MKTFLLRCCLTMLIAAWTATAHADIRWRVSVKLILDANGNRPASGTLNTPTKIREQVDQANLLLDGFRRGVRFDLIEVVELSGVSQHFNSEIGATTLLAIEASAKLDQTRYHWRNDAINVFINGSAEGAGGICAFPNTGADAALIGQGSSDRVIIHELGHFFGLCHAHGCLSGDCDSGSDGISDTLTDAACWTKDDISFANFFPPFPYAALSAANQRKVDDAFGNIMSYHDKDNRYYLSPKQLDVEADNSNGPRNNVASGRFRFVDQATTCALQDGSPSCDGVDVFGPFDNLRDGVTAANSGDVLLVGAGTYTTQTLFDKPLTLRSWHGTVIIRSP